MGAIQWSGRAASALLGPLPSRASTKSITGRVLLRLSAEAGDRRCGSAAVGSSEETPSSDPAAQTVALAAAGPELAAVGTGSEAPGAGGRRMPEKASEPLDRTLRERLLEVLQPPLDLRLSFRGPLVWPSELMPFQLAGVRALLDHDRLLLADEMGLGKTVQALAAIRIMVLTGRLGSCLVVVPASLVGQWRSQADRWAPELRLTTVRGPAQRRLSQWRSSAHIHLTSYETVRSDSHVSREREWDLVVLDEAQMIKNAGTEVALVVKRLLRRRAWALTGTPWRTGWRISPPSWNSPSRGLSIGPPSRWSRTCAFAMR